MALARALDARESGAQEQRFEFVRCVLVRMLGVDPLAALEGARDAVDHDRLRDTRFEMHFDA